MYFKYILVYLFFTKAKFPALSIFFCPEFKQYDNITVNQNIFDNNENSWSGYKYKPSNRHPVVQHFVALPGKDKNSS